MAFLPKGFSVCRWSFQEPVALPHPSGLQNQNPLLFQVIQGGYDPFPGLTDGTTDPIHVQEKPGPARLRLLENVPQESGPIGIETGQDLAGGFLGLKTELRVERAGGLEDPIPFQIGEKGLDDQRPDVMGVGEFINGNAVSPPTGLRSG